MPGLGPAGGRFQLSTGWHSAWADRSYFDGHSNHVFNQRWMPTERISVLDVSGRWNVNRRFSVTATLPIAMNRFSSLLPPTGEPTGERYPWSAKGIGDVTIYTQTWLLKPETHPEGNVALGLGLKIPTGRWNLTKYLPNFTDTQEARRALWPSPIMPGDGGVAPIFGLSGYKVVHAKRYLPGMTLFGSAQYMMNPRITNNTPSTVAALGVPLTPQWNNVLVNSVADSYAWQAGASVKIPGTWKYENLRGMRARFITSMEGTPAHDLIFSSKGYRIPGWAVSIGPGFSYQRKRDLWIVDIPFVIARHIDPRATALPGPPVKGPNGTLLPAPFNPNRQMGLIAPLSINIRYVRTL